MFRFFYLLSAVATALSGPAGKVQLESDVSVFSSPLWQREPISSADFVKAIFVLKHDEAKFAAFEQRLLELSTPSHADYGKWLTKEQVVERLSPDAASLKIVTDYIESYGVLPENYRVSIYNDKVFVTLPIPLATQMLSTEFSRFRSLDDDRVVIVRATQPYYLPASVAGVVALVDDIIRFPSIRRVALYPAANSTSTSPFDSCGQSCSGFTTPAVLQQAYSFSPVKSAAKGNSVAVTEFQGQYYDDADLQAFSKACGVTTEVDVYYGPTNSATNCQKKNGCVEALLDIEYIGAIVHPIPLTDIYQQQYSLLDWIDYVLTLKNPPLVQSVSYGNDEVQQTSTSYMQSVNTQFAAASSQGISILFAAGDQGVWGRSGQDGNVYHPDFPATSPYVTAVGGTNFAKKSVIGEETAWNCGGGGFSTVFSIPSFQADVVQKYLTTASSKGVLPPSKYFNSKGRAYPDVSALGGQTNPYCISTQWGETFAGVAGTSASCPVVAGIIAQLNNVRLSNGKSSLGWLNPLLYANPSCFQDVNDGSQNNCIKGTQGFAALDGWDPATGLGTPNYQCLAKVVS